jgi:hypothetical protein
MSVGRSVVGMGKVGLVVGTVVSGGVVGSGLGGVVDWGAFLGSVGLIVSVRGFGAGVVGVARVPRAR